MGDLQRRRVPAAAEHEVVEQVSPEMQEELLQTQEAGADADGGEATENTDTPAADTGSDENKEG